MKWVSVAFMVILCGALAGMLACSAEQVRKTAEDIRDGAGAAAPLLPPPFGTILGLVAGGAGLVATMAAAKSKGAAIVADIDPHPVTNFISSHTWIMPAIMAAAGFARMKGLIHLSDSEITALFSALGLATVGHVIADGKAEAKVPAPSPTA